MIRVSANKFFRYNYSTFSSIYLMDPAVVSARKKPLTPQKKPVSAVAAPAAETSVNWVTAGYSTPIKNQGACGEGLCEGGSDNDPTTHHASCIIRIIDLLPRDIVITT